MGKTIDLIKVWAHEYFKHPLENIRQANPVVPGRLYRNFGNVCKAVPLSQSQKKYIEESREYGALAPCILDDIERSGNGIKSMRMIQERTEDGPPVRCNFCDFYRNGIPCPVINTLADGSLVCETHRYIIIKPVKI